MLAYKTVLDSSCLCSYVNYFILTKWTVAISCPVRQNFQGKFVPPDTSAWRIDFPLTVVAIAHSEILCFIIIQKTSNLANLLYYHDHSGPGCCMALITKAC